VEIDLLLPKPERLSIPERKQFHAQGGRVKSDGGIDAGYRKNKMVEMINNNSIPHFNRRHERIAAGVGGTPSEISARAAA